MSATEQKQSEIQRRLTLLNNLSLLFRQHQMMLEIYSYDHMQEVAPDRDFDEMSYISHWMSGNSVEFQCHGPEQLELAKMLRRAIGGQWEKHPDDHYYRISRQWNRIRVTIVTERDKVCTKRIVGIERHVIPARDKQVFFRDKVEWDCDILNDAS